MARDYKHRAQMSGHHRYGDNRRKPARPAKVVVGWLLVIAIVIVVVIYSVVGKLKSASGSSAVEAEKTAELADTIKQEIQVKVPEPVQSPKPETQPVVEAQKPVEPEEPRYDFYTILPQAETEVPDYEIKTRVREELVGKTKAVKYTMQVGSFRESVEADQQRAKLALLGIQSRIEKAKVGEVIWHRVKIGPYENPTSVSNIKEILQKNGFGVIVTEGG